MLYQNQIDLEFDTAINHVVCKFNTHVMRIYGINNKQKS